MHADLCVHMCAVPSVSQPVHRDVMGKNPKLSCRCKDADAESSEEIQF